MSSKGNSFVSSNIETNAESRQKIVDGVSDNSDGGSGIGSGKQW